MEIKGRIIHILPLQEGVSKAGNPWKKQEYVLETLDQYPKKVCFDLFGDKADQYRAEIGDEVVLSFDIESREYNGRWFNEIRLDAVTFVGASASKNPQPVNQPAGGANGQQVNNTSQQAIGGPQTPPFQPQAAPLPPQTDANGNPINKEGGDDDLPF